MKEIVASALLSLFLISASCQKCHEKGFPCSVNKIIDGIMSEPPTDPRMKIYQYYYNGAKVYFVPKSAVCCDNFSDLYDCSGNLICHPDGGLKAGGDGRCSDFFDKRSGEKLIWEDKR